MKKKLLLADDSITIQKVVGIIFATEDYELLTASDGDKALELALAHKPDLVIADIVMPGKNGFELCRAIKSHPALGSTSVLLLPGAFEEFDEASAVEVCADGWLTKPFESQALIDKVTALSEMPPLRLVAAAEEEAEVLEEMVPAAQDAVDGEPLTLAEDDFFAAEESGAERTDEIVETSEVVEDSDSEIWGEVSFEEEDLKPQELLAASDQDEEEAADYSTQDEELYEPAQRLTPEQLAPYVTTPPSVAPADDPATPEFEPLPAETAEDFEFITDQPDSEEALSVEEPEFSAAVPMDEPDTSFEFAAQDTLEATTDDIDEMPELLEEDLEQEEALVEDSSTFIDLTAANEEVTAEDTTADDEILDLTEGDVLEEDEAVVAMAEDLAPLQTPSDERDDLFEDPLEQVTEEDETAEVSYGRRDDDLFTDGLEEAATAEHDADSAAGAAAEFKAELEAEGLIDLETEEDDEVYSPVFSTATAPSAEMVEEQLRQLPEEEVKQIVEKVAGPLIERLAREMLERVVWEVVPDLAETMISAEIEKIKRGES